MVERVSVGGGLVGWRLGGSDPLCFIWRYEFLMEALECGGCRLRGRWIDVVKSVGFALEVWNEVAGWIPVVLRVSGFGGVLAAFVE